MEATGQEGILIQGPGIRVEAGHYLVRVLGGGTGSGRVDVLAAAGAREYAHGQIVSVGDDQPAVLAEIDLRLVSDAEDLEVRIWVPAGASVWLTAIEILPGSATCRIAA
jgi:hypothetical protein